VLPCWKHDNNQHSAQEIGPTSRFERALHHDLPEFGTFHSGRRRTPDTLKSQSSIATAASREMYPAVETIIGLESHQLSDFASGDVNE